MRYVVPTRARVMYPMYNSDLDPYGTQSEPVRGNLANYLAFAGDLVEVDSPNFFWDTDGRVFNDCVHSKLVDADGRAQGVPVSDGSCILTNSYATGPGPLTSYRTRDGRAIHGIGNMGKSYNHWAYSLIVTRPTNTVNLKIDCYIWWNIEWENKVAWYGTSGSRKRYLSFTINGKKVDEVAKVGYRLRHTNTTVSYNTLNIDTSTLVSGLEALYDTIEYKWYPVLGGTYYCIDSHVSEKMLELVSAFVEGKINPFVTSIRYGGLPRMTVAKSVTVHVDLPKAEDNFLLHEDEIIAQGVDPYLACAGQDTSHYFWNVLVQNAYLDALNSVPKLNDNSISNIIEIVAFIKALVIDHKIEIPKSLSSAWLSYRYVYTTGKLDAKEAIDFVHRHMDLGSFDKWISCYGASSIEYDGTLISCRCGLDIRPKELATLAKIWRGLYTYGLQPNFYVIWDMIPYSFIVDWFIPVGRLASVLDAESQYNETNYEIANLIFSFSYDRLVDGFRYHQYTRFLSPGVVTLNGFYFFEEDPVSSKVVGYRVLDTLSLLLGRRK